METKHWYLVSAIALLILGADLLKWMWGAYLAVTVWNIGHYLNGYPCIYITEQAWMLQLEMTVILICIVVIIISVVNLYE